MVSGANVTTEADVMVAVVMAVVVMAVVVMVADVMVADVTVAVVIVAVVRPVVREGGLVVVATLPLGSDTELPLCVEMELIVELLSSFSFCGTVLSPLTPLLLCNNQEEGWLKEGKEAGSELAVPIVNANSPDLPVPDCPKTNGLLTLAPLGPKETDLETGGVPITGTVACGLVRALPGEKEKEVEEGRDVLVVVVTVVVVTVVVVTVVECVVASCPTFELVPGAKDERRGWLLEDRREGICWDCCWANLGDSDLMMTTFGDAEVVGGAVAAAAVAKLA